MKIVRKKIRIFSFLFSLAMVFSAASSAPCKSDTTLDNWKEKLKIEAIEKGISKNTLDLAIDDFKPIKRVIELDRRQPEFTLTLDQYLKRVIPSRRIKKGRLMLAKNNKILEKIGKKYSVQPRFIIALWGIETDFGRLDGGFSVVHSLATLALDGRRSKFFRKELIRALRILDQGHINIRDMRGSWAGAMGHFQFMPSSFENFAVDYDNDGKRDIWRNKKDAFASAANYLSKSGWKSDQTWGREVRIPEEFDGTLINSKSFKRMSKWRSLGIKRANGRDLPSRELLGALVKSKDRDSKVYLVYKNYFTILKWNRSLYFAVAVGSLADAIVSKHK
tara:strand:- start:105 stop:1106 length:1002 start_codon:yes stop_codon:yes gene_type:complete